MNCIVTHTCSNIGELNIKLTKFISTFIELFYILCI